MRQLVSLWIASNWQDKRRRHTIERYMSQSSSWIRIRCVVIGSVVIGNFADIDQYSSVEVVSGGGM